jgi:F0F1-type ATP synthase membrane subunit b/b'
VRFVDRKYGLDLQQIRSALVVQPDRRGVVRWEDFSAALPDEKMMDPAPDPQAGFAGLEPPLSDPRQMTALRKDFADWIFRTGRVIVRANRALGVFATPDISQAELMKACAEAARERRDTAVAKATAAIDRQIKTLADRIAREERELKMDEAELGQRKSEEVATHAENVLGVFGRGRSGRRLSTSLSKHRMTSQAREDVQESVDALAQYRQQLAELEASRQQILVNAGDQWGEAVNDIDEIPVAPRKADVYVSMFGVAWLPRYRVRAGDEELEIPAYAAPE